MDFKRDEQYSRRDEKFRELYLFWKRTSAQVFRGRRKFEVATRKFRGGSFDTVHDMSIY